MLHLKFALNLEHLADEMIEEISKNWNDPFNAPVVIFPDFKLEQWFRLKWIKKKGSLLNLNNCSIDKFLFDILSADKTKRQKLNAEMLCNVILAYLQQVDETTNKLNWQTLDNEVKRYLFGDGEPDSKAQPDANRLFDFANKMASLFLEYEASRPKEFAGNPAGLLDKWALDSNKDPFFFAASVRDKSNKDSVKARETWQRKLYSAIFHDKNGEISLLKKVFAKEAERKGSKKDYQTIPYLYKTWNGTFNLENIGTGKEGKPLPVFIFGLSGMGQFYRVILQKYAEKHDVYAYIQNPCMEFWEDAKLESNSECHINWKNKKDIPAAIQEKLKVQNYSSQPKDNNDEQFDIDDIKEENVSEENPLLANWGRSGRDNIKLWCLATDYEFDFDASTSPQKGEELKQDSLLHCVQYSIAHRKGDFSDANLEDVFEKDGLFKSLTVKSAPTKIREIEYLHSDICKLLQGDARVEDILVVSPCLDEYRTAIKMVFDQTPVKQKKDEKKKSDGFLHVRFAIVDSPAKASLTENALQSLFDVLDRGSISRPEFFSLVRNPVVQQARGISDDDVADWENWIVETNTYRDRKASHKKDWLHSVNRLLLSHMTRKNVKWSDCEDLDETKPFYDIASGDKASLCRFVQCVEDLEEWIGNYNKPVTDLDSLTEALGKWIRMQKAPDSMKSETFVYQRVVATIEQLRYQQDAGLKEIPLKIVAQSLLAGAEGTEYSCGNLFVNGITFMKFAPNRTVPVKHLFFIGADSASFPGAKRHNTLDLRKSCPPWPGDDSPIAKNRYAFLCQLMSASESFHLSYVGKDIKKDAELYPSSVISDLQKFVSEALKNTKYTWKTEELPLDETRDPSELFTKKSIRNKIAYVNMVTGKKPNNPPKDDNDGASAKNDAEKNGGKNDDLFVKPPDRVSFYQLRKFLEDPFQFHVGRTLSDEDDENVEQELFEPVSLNHLDESIILKKAIAAELSDDAGEYEKYKKELKLSGKMPDKLFGDEFWNKIEASKRLILEQMINDGIVINGAEDNPEESDGEKVIANCSFAKDWTYGEKIKDLQLSRESDEDTHWLLSGTLDWINVKNDANDNLNWDNVSQLMSVSSSTSATSKFGLDKFLSSYIQALVILSNQKEKTETNTVEIKIFSCDKDKGGPTKAFVTQKPSDAKKKLEEIYKDAFGVIAGNKKDQPFSKAVPAKILDWPEKPEDLNIFEFKDKLNEKHGGAWNYFDKKSLFDVLKDVGYSATSFNQEWPNAVNKMKGLIDIKFPEEPKKEPVEEVTAASTTDEPKKKANKSKKAK